MIPVTYGYARVSKTGDATWNPETVNGGGKVGHWGDGMVDHQHGGSWQGRESWR